MKVVVITGPGEEWLRRITSHLSRMEERIIMALEQLGDKVTALEAAIVQEKNEVSLVINDLTETVNELREQIATGTPTVEEIEALAARIDSAIVSLQGIVETPTPAPEG